MLRFLYPLLLHHAEIAPHILLCLFFFILRLYSIAGTKCPVITHPKNGIASQFGFFLQLRCNSGYFFNPQPPGYTGLFVNPSYRCQDNKWTAMFSPNAVLSGKLDCMSKLLFGYSL